MKIFPKVRIKVMKMIMIIVNILVASILLIPTSVIAESNTDDSRVKPEESIRTNQISKEDATKALKNYIKQQGYEHGNIHLQEELYDVDDSILAYYYTIDDKAGYYIVTAKDTLNPIMEYSQDAPYPVDLNNKDKNEKAYYVSLNNIIFASNAREIQNKFDKDKKEKLNQSEIEEIELEKLKKEKLLEKEKIEISVKQKAKSLGNQDTISQNQLIQINNEITHIDNKLQDYDDSQFKLENRKLKPFKTKEQRSSQWDELLNSQKSVNSEVTYSTAASISAKLDVPRWYQRMEGVVNPSSACGPTVGAMVMNYYHDKRGFTTVRDDSYFNNSKADAINNMRYDMRSNFWGIFGATLSDYMTGTATHISETATSDWYAVSAYNTYQSDSYSNSMKYRNAISSQHPVGIRFQYNVENEEGLDYHFVAGVGWYLNGVDNGNLMVTFENPDGGSPSYQSFDWGNLYSDFDFAYLNFE